MPRISAEPVLQKSGMSVFDLSMIIRKPKTFFSSASEYSKRYEFKALSEADMIDWIAALQKSLKYENYAKEIDKMLGPTFLLGHHRPCLDRRKPLQKL